MIQGKSVLAIVPARGGSKGIPHKNIISLAGHPLVSYTIRAAIECSYIDMCIVSTDDAEIARVSLKYGAKVPFLRPDYLSTDTAKSIDVLLHAVNEVHYNNRLFDIAVLLQPTSPLRTSDDIVAALEFFIENKCDSLLSVSEMLENPVLIRKFEKSDGRLVSLLPGESTIRRQEMSPYYVVNGAIYINYVSELSTSTSLNDNHYGYIIPNSHSVDIDEYKDIEIAEKIIKGELGN